MCIYERFFSPAILLHRFSFWTLSLLLYAMNVKQESEVKERLKTLVCDTAQRSTIQYNSNDKEQRKYI